MHSGFFRIWVQFALRETLRHPGLAALNIAGIAIGGAVYLAVATANRSAERSFEAGLDLIAGKADLEARGPIRDDDIPRAAAVAGVTAVTPVVEAAATLPDYPGEYLQIVGVDIFTNAPFRTFEIAGDTGDFDPALWLGQPGALALQRPFADRLGLRVGDRFALEANGVRREATVAFLMVPDESSVGTNAHFAAMDLGWAQEWFMEPGTLSSLQIQADTPEQTADRLREALGPAARVGAPEQRSFQVQKMLRAFRLNLTALSMVAMLVGMFLVYNTVSASVVRRRRQIGMLRAMGATRREVAGWFLAEAAAFGILGAALGALIGALLAGALVDSVARAISSLYVLVRVDRWYFSLAHAAIAGSLSAAAALAAAWLPAREAASLQAARVLHPGSSLEGAPAVRRIWGVAAATAFACGSAAAWGALLGAGAWLGFASAFCFLGGFALLAPSCVGSAGARLERAPIHALGRIAAQHLRRALWRNSMTVAALSMAVAMLAAITVMVHSFRQTVSTWMGTAVAADLFVAPSANETVGLQSLLPPETETWWASRDGVRAVERFREAEAMADHEPVALAVVDGVEHRDLRFHGGDAERKHRAVAAGEAVAVSESFARKHREPDSVTLATPVGPVSFPVAGVYTDYTKDRGVVLIARPLFDRYWDAPGNHSLAVHLAPGADPEVLAAAFRNGPGNAGTIAVYSRAALRERIFAIFDQTFAVTDALKAVAVAVAVAGVTLSMTALVTERRREIGVLRAIGASARQIRHTFLAESGLIGALASALGLVSGIALAGVLTFVINPAFFGWTILMEIPWATLATVPLWVTAVAVAAAWIPARAAARVQPAEAVRFE